MRVADRRGHRGDPGLALGDDCAQPRRRTSASVRSVNVASASTARWVDGSAQAISTFAPDPAVIGSRAPTGTVSRSPDTGSAAATQTRVSPSRR